MVSSAIFVSQFSKKSKFYIFGKSCDAYQASFQQQSMIYIDLENQFFSIFIELVFKLHKALWARHQFFLLDKNDIISVQLLKKQLLWIETVTYPFFNYSKHHALNQFCLKILYLM